jgi:type I restriction enzyme M protein
MAPQSSPRTESTTNLGFEQKLWLDADKQPPIGKILDDTMVDIEADNPRMKGILPKDYARPALHKHPLGELIDLSGTIGLGNKDIIDRVYKYFLTPSASAESKNYGQFYAPSCVVWLIIEMLAPYKSRVYDPACGSGGIFVQSEEFVESHGGKLGDISIEGQESNATTQRHTIMNLANGSTSSNQSDEGDIRRTLIEADLVAWSPSPASSPTARRLPSALVPLENQKCRRQTR